MITAALLYDSGAHAGMGHERRMRALGSALARRSVDVGLLPVPAVYQAADVFVVDSYTLDAGRCRGWTKAVVAIDDLGRDLDVDLLIDPNPGAEPGSRLNAGRILTGAAFALIPDDVVVMTGRPVVVGDGRRVLVTCGAADRRGQGQVLAAELHKLVPDAEVRLVIGPWSAQAVPAGTYPIRTTDGLAEELRQATVVVTAGGVTMVESLALGRPTVIIIVAANQSSGARAAAGAGAAILAPSPAEAARLAAQLLDDLPRQIELSRIARSMVDGLGAHRVAEEALRLVSQLP